MNGSEEGDQGWSPIRIAACGVMLVAMELTAN